MMKTVYCKLCKTQLKLQGWSDIGFEDAIQTFVCPNKDCIKSPLYEGDKNAN